MKDVKTKEEAPDAKFFVKSFRGYIAFYTDDEYLRYRAAASALKKVSKGS